MYVSKGIFMKAKDIVIGSVWQGNSDGDYLAIVDEIFFGNYQVDVKLTIINKCTNELFTKGFNSTYFLKAYSLLVKGRDLNEEYVKGKTDGYSEGYKHGFTLAKEKITELDEEELESEYQRGLKEGKYLEGLDSLNSRQHHYHLGYDAALVDVESGAIFKKAANESCESSNNEQLIDAAYEQGYKEGLAFGSKQGLKDISFQKDWVEAEKAKSFQMGYKEGEADMLETVNDLSAQQAEDYNNGDYISVKDFGVEGYIVEQYPVTDGIDIIEFIKNNYDNIKSFTQVGDVGSIEMFDKRVDAVCEHHNPNKETQEAMQEVLDKDDAVNSPKHYNSDPSGVQCIEITRHRNNNIGNVIKYLWRNGLKDGNSNIQDLKKGAWYLNDEIQRLKGLKDD